MCSSPSRRRVFHLTAGFVANHFKYNGNANCESTTQTFHVKTYYSTLQHVFSSRIEGMLTHLAT